ncbi:hypothetical protein ACFQRB_08965 [Halobaculum litoreum]|uniref:Halobacterial output domain-containing protein n=1 Tax=Halobaculum litoreum TaxID=3031998 RepID=A0ABD5XN47_9EURY
MTPDEERAGDGGDAPDGREWDDPESVRADRADGPAAVHITADLLSLLLERAAAADPDDENVVLDASAAGDLVDPPADLPPRRRC